MEDEYSKPLVGDWPIEKLTNYVDQTMPDYDPDVVTGKEAQAISKFVFDSFYKNLNYLENDQESNLPV